VTVTPVADSWGTSVSVDSWGAGALDAWGTAPPTTTAAPRGAGAASTSAPISSPPSLATDSWGLETGTAGDGWGTSTSTSTSIDGLSQGAKAAVPLVGAGAGAALRVGVGADDDVSGTVVPLPSASVFGAEDKEDSSIFGASASVSGGAASIFGADSNALFAHTSIFGAGSTFRGGGGGGGGGGQREGEASIFGAGSIFGGGAPAAAPFRTSTSTASSGIPTTAPPPPPPTPNPNQTPTLPESPPVTLALPKHLLLSQALRPFAPYYLYVAEEPSSSRVNARALEMLQECVQGVVSLLSLEV
jgi:hypothetical protein